MCEGEKGCSLDPDLRPVSVEVKEEEHKPVVAATTRALHYTVPKKFDPDDWSTNFIGER